MFNINTIEEEGDMKKTKKPRPVRLTGWLFT
jgi:hypothetical protein